MQALAQCGQSMLEVEKYTLPNATRHPERPRPLRATRSTQAKPRPPRTVPWPRGARSIGELGLDDNASNFSLTLKNGSRKYNIYIPNNLLL